MTPTNPANQPQTAASMPDWWHDHYTRWAEDNDALLLIADGDQWTAVHLATGTASFGPTPTEAVKMVTEAKALYDETVAASEVRDE